MNLPGKLFALAMTFLCLNSFAQKSYDFKKAENESRRLLLSNPEAALPIIKETLRQKGNIHDTIYGNTYNLYGIYYSSRGHADSSIYYAKKALKYLDDYPRARARTLLTIAMAYRKKADYNGALKYLDILLEINKKEKSNNAQAMIYGEMAANYNMMQNYDKSIELLLKGISMLKGEKDGEHRVLPMKINLANTYLAKENYKFAIDLYNECLPALKQANTMKNYYIALVNKGEAHLRLNDYAAAKQALSTGIEGLTKFRDTEFLGIAYSKLAKIEYLTGDADKAIDIYKKAYNYLKESKTQSLIRVAGEYIDVLNADEDYNTALKLISEVSAMKLIQYANMQDRMVYKNAVANTYKGANNYKEAIKAYEHTISIKDSIALREKERAVEEIQAKFQTELQREKNIALKANNDALQKMIESEHKLVLLYVITSIILAAFFIAMIRAYKLKNKLQKEALKAVEVENEMIKQQSVYEQDLLKQHKDTIDEKQRELTSTALRMANYQDNINQIIEKCESNEFTKVGEVKKELEHLIKQKDYWKQFETRFNSLHPEFNAGLVKKYSKLTKNDLEFCALLKLNLSNKEIASLLQISHESAITKKYRIKKKMGISDDAEFEKLIMEM